MDALPPRPPPPRWRAALRETPVTWAVAAANIGWFAWMASHGSTTDPDVLVRFGALDPARVRAGEWWRLLTAAFVHVGPIHLGMNMLFGIPWCRQLERALRPRRFAGLYLASAVAGTAASLAGQGVLSAGASGAIFGVIGATLALHRRALGGWRAFAASPGARAVLGNLVVLAVAGLWLPLDQWAHGAGLACGAAMATIWTRPSPRRLGPWVALGAALALVTFAALRPGRPESRYEREREVDERLADATRHFRADDVPAARHDLERARALGVPDPRLDVYEAQALLLEGRRDEALRLLESACRAGNGAACEGGRRVRKAPDGG
jgi:rhomboid protease GluP